MDNKSFWKNLGEKTLGETQCFGFECDNLCSRTYWAKTEINFFIGVCFVNKINFESSWEYKLFFLREKLICQWKSSGLLFGY